MINFLFKKKKTSLEQFKTNFDKLPEYYKTAILNALWRRSNDDYTPGVENDRIKYACNQMAMFFVTGEMGTP